MKVIESLGIKDQVLRKSTVAKDGVETMRLVLEEKFDIGVTQVSEILQAIPEAIAGPLTKEFDLATTYALLHRENISLAPQFFAALMTHPAHPKTIADKRIWPAP